MDSTLTQHPARAGGLIAAAEDVALQLPFDHARTPATRHRPACHAFQWSVPALPGVSTDALLGAIFGVALSRYSAQASIPFAVARLLASGQVLSLSALHAQTGPGVTLTNLLKEMAVQMATVTSVAVKADIPGSAWGAGGGRAAVTFIESELGETPDVLRVLASSSMELRSADLQCVVTGAGDTRHCALVYNANLFKASSIARFAGHLDALLAHAPTHLDAPIVRLPLLTASEREWLEATSSGPLRALPSEFLHQSFEANCAAAPGGIALRHRDQQLAYAELNRRANRLAHHLIAQRIGVDDPVLVCVEPGFDIAVALLGILKAGAVYVPLDPGYPPARIRAILDDTRPKLVLTRSHLIDKLGLDREACFGFDTQDSALARLPTHNPGLPVDPAQTASVYYTSGTTGQPKGVMASQANLRAYIDLARERYAFSARDVMPAIARFSFSISMFELMLPLVAGGTLVILDRDHVLDLERMSHTLREVTFFHAGPSLLKNLLAHIRQTHADFRAFAGVRHASSGGDMIAPEVLEALKAIFSNAEVFVIYGCSEISCMGCTYPVPRDTTVTRTFVGRPFDNMVVKVLDAALNPVPAGIVGEIHFAGAGVVKGYLNRPELSAEKFIQVGHRRFYRTGDMGRLNEDGWLEILGRNDFQINVRGMRIEIGEVEYNLRKAPGVRDAVVMAKAAASGEKILVAYVVPDAKARAGAANAAERTAAVRRHMAEHLPDYMVPASYVELESLPLNHNMKVDRRALPEPVFAQLRVDGDPLVRAPESATETALAALWKQLLGLRQVGLDDNFFELGGQSLNAMEFIVRAKQTLGAELRDMEVLRESLEVLASMCDQRLGRAAHASARHSGATAPRGGIETFHFGHARSLYGVLHAGDSDSCKAEQAVLICSPVGQEHVRTHFILNRLSRQLASQGVPVLRFDYFGCADSLGSGIEAGCERWQNDIVDAYRELIHRTGARHVVGVGARLGGTLLCAAMRRLDLARLVLWDPIGDGARFHAVMSEMQRRYVRATQDLRRGRKPRSVQGGQELLGATYSDAAIRELKALKLAPTESRGSMPLRWLVTSEPGLQQAHFQRVGKGRGDSRLERLEFDCAWHDIAQMSEVLPDVGISKTLADMVRGVA